jgi:hypothetical protein
MAVFCGCLPLRVGALLLTTLQLIIGAGTAVLLWWEILDGSAPFTTLQQFALYTSVSVNMLLALIAFYGLIGTLARHTDILKSFFYVQIVQTALSLGAAIIILIALFSTDRNTMITQCTSGNAQIFPTLGSAKSKGQCGDLLQGARYVYSTHLAVLVLIQIYSVITIPSYTTELKHSDTFRRKSQQIFFEPDQHKHKQTFQSNV